MNLMQRPSSTHTLGAWERRVTMVYASVDHSFCLRAPQATAGLCVVAVVVDILVRFSPFTFASGTSRWSFSCCAYLQSCERRAASDAKGLTLSSDSCR